MSGPQKHILEKPFRENQQGSAILRGVVVQGGKSRPSGVFFCWVVALERRRPGFLESGALTEHRASEWP